MSGPSMLKLPPPDEGVLFVITGPSGVGKSTLIKAALKVVPGLDFSVSATTRSPRRGEKDGVDYVFLEPVDFAQRVEAGEFLEYAEVYGRAYGTLKAPIEHALEQGRSVLLDIDIAGARQVRGTFPHAVHLFVLPPDRDTLERRLRHRDTDSEAVITQRLDEVGEQLRACGEYDYVMVNDDLATAHHLFQGILMAELSRRKRRQSAVDPWLVRRTSLRGA